MNRPHSRTEARIRRLQDLVEHQVDLGYYPLSMLLTGLYQDDAEEYGQRYTRPAPQPQALIQSGGASAVGHDAAPAGLSLNGDE